MEVKEAYSSLRQTQFRSGLRLKRLAVQSRVFAEIAQLHLERVCHFPFFLFAFFCAG